MLCKCKDKDNFLNIKQKIIFCFIFSVFLAFFAQSQTSQQLEYVAKYRYLAIQHQRQYGIPASITLAQALLESASGGSKLAREGNNHFGVKCHRSFQGDSVYIGSTCYRRYTDVEQSYLDHSRFLQGQRYSELFQLDITDYRAWAHGIKRCGYATDPAYASKLIAMIEMCHLSELDHSAVQDEIIAAELAKQPQNSANVAANGKKRRNLPDVMHNVHRKWGLHCVRVVAGDTWEGLAKEFNVKSSKLLGFNDVKGKNPEPPRPGMMVYLEKKNPEATEGHEVYTFKEGDTLWTVAQTFGIRLDDLMKLNNLKKGSGDPAPGDRIILRN